MVITKFTWTGDHYVLGFAPSLKVLLSQILCSLHKSPSDEAIIPLHVYHWWELPQVSFLS